MAKESIVEYTDDLYKIAKSIFIQVSQDNINATKGLISWTKQFFASNKNGFWYYVFAGIGVAKIISFLFK